jgi:hypothetical protein
LFHLFKQVAGDRFVVFSDEKQARRIGESRHEASIVQQRQESKNVSLLSFHLVSFVQTGYLMKHFYFLDVVVQC